MTTDEKTTTTRPEDRASRGSRWGWTLPLLLAAILGVLELSSRTGLGYLAGWADHFVLSTEGINWVRPDAYANDWFMESAPQPHWFFDLLTSFGESLHILPLVYGLYWAAGLLAFGAATAMLARHFVPSASASVGVLVTVVAGLMPWMLGGTGTPVIAIALPAVLSANMIYLLIAGMLTERRLLVVIVGPAISVVHVQQGSIAIVLMVALLIVEAVRDRRVDWWLALAGGLTAAVVGFGLLIRPVASNLADFVEICDTMIPYHCAAHTWDERDIVSTLGLILLTSLSVFALPRARRWLWLSTVGLATLGYAGGFAMDALSVPVLGPLAQGVNVYRLAAVLIPFAVWGAVTPLLSRARGWRYVALLAAWGLGWLMILTAWGFVSAGPLISRLVFYTLALLIPFLGFAVLRQLRRDHVRTRPAAALIASVLVLAAAAGNGGLALRAPDFAITPFADFRVWGENAERAVPAGESIVASPQQVWIKFVSERAVIADCKNVPYGGEPWAQWKKRLAELGGYEQCLEPRAPGYSELSVDALIDLADEYDSDFIAVATDAPVQLEGMERAGWDQVVDAEGDAYAVLFRRPGS
ncbi:DUF6798 domain-containing protein [Microbacterium sp. SA39]|uniref:DUF6798 domain-containing protein n=1 Tax=Microbacterium sp. SA39 TaxID=1263625 RepID=UPI0005FA5CBB|nr:DUF6798 domain-containing protein [Microbacterium sp. SA39]KJQ53667.1 hypothetical protein RS85_02699 [Microbacterium sp. SA39]